LLLQIFFSDVFNKITGNVITGNVVATNSISVVRSDCGTYTGGYTCYSSLSAWETGEQRNLVASNEIATARIEGVWTQPDNSVVTISGWTTSPTNYIRIYTTPEARHNGKWDTGAYMLGDGLTHGRMISIVENYVKVEGIQIYTSNWGNDYGIYVTGIESSISNNILKGKSGGATLMFFYADANGITGNQKIWNNILYNSGGEGIYSYDSASIYSNTVYNTSLVGIYGYNFPAGKVILKNNIVQNTTDCYQGGFGFASDYNICNFNDVDTSNNIFTGGVSSVNFVNSSIGDFHLSSLDTSALNRGIGLSSDSNLAFTNDIDGQIRTGTWDIGADEYVQSGLDLTSPITIASPFGGTYTSTQSVSLTANEPATIYYTTNGLIPTISSNIYSTSIIINKNITLRYFSKDTAGNMETVKTQNYIINIPVQTNQTLLWSTTYDCAEWNFFKGEAKNILNCDGLSGAGQSFTNSFGTYGTQITLNANNPLGIGRGQRSWECDGWNQGTGGLYYSFNQPQSEFWIRWYLRYEKGFQWSPLGYDKLLYIFTSTHGAEIIPEWVNGDRFNMEAQGGWGASPITNTNAGTPDVVVGQPGKNIDKKVSGINSGNETEVLKKKKKNTSTLNSKIFIGIIILFILGVLGFLIYYISKIKKKDNYLDVKRKEFLMKNNGV